MMKYDWIDEYLLAKKGVNKDFKEEWNWRRYMIQDKTHWNFIKVDGAITDDMMRDLLDKSYNLVLAGFSKKKQAEILNQ